MNLIIFFLTDIIKFCIIIPVVLAILLSVYKKKRSGNNELNKLSIITETNISTRLCVCVFILLLLFVGILLVCLSLTATDIVFNMVIGNVVGILLCVISIAFLVSTFKGVINVLSGKYEIIVDELTAFKYQKNEIHIDGNTSFDSYWKLYFKDLYNKYKTYVMYKRKWPYEFKKGDKFYLVFIKDYGTEAYPLKTYTLSEKEKDKLKSIDKATKYINKK